MVYDFGLYRCLVRVFCGVLKDRQFMELQTKSPNGESLKNTHMLSPETMMSLAASERSQPQWKLTELIARMEFG